MEDSKILAIMSRKWIVLLCAMFVTVKSEDQTGLPGTGLLCISECATCPVICSPPPPPVNTKPPPSPPVHHYSPPESYFFNSPPPTETPSPPPPPPSYISWGATPPPVNIPSIQEPPGIGQRNYSYPYYYFSASKASFPLQDSSPFMLLLAFHAMYFYL